MNDYIRKNISNLYINDTAKNALFSMDRMLNSPSAPIRSSAPAPLLVAGEGCGLTSYGRAFSEIINYSPYCIKAGSSNYLELVFPKDNEEDERLFFSSPVKAASTANRFYGTMIISFKEFSGNDLIKSESFERLIGFCRENKENIHFLFHIKPDFDEVDRLVLELQTVFPIMMIDLDKPDDEKSFEYLKSEIEKREMRIDDDAVEFLRDKVIPFYISQNDFSGFNSLNNLLSRLTYEIFMTADSEECLITKNILGAVMEKMQNESAVDDDRKIGFCL